MPWPAGRAARRRSRGTVQLAAQSMDGLPPHRRAAHGLVLVPEGKGIFADLTVTENLALVRPPADTTGRHLFSMEEIHELFPPPGRTARATRAHAVGRRAADGGGEPRAARRAARAAARRAVGGPGAAAGLRAARHDARLVDRGLSLLLVEQNVRATLELVDELYLLERGKVVAKGPAASMKDDPRILEAYLGSLTA